eukprot:1133671-Pelagomonas_calceolata.AAC.19
MQCMRSRVNGGRAFHPRCRPHHGVSQNDSAWRVFFLLIGVFLIDVDVAVTKVAPHELQTLHLRANHQNLILVKKAYTAFGRQGHSEQAGMLGYTLVIET